MRRAETTRPVTIVLMLPKRRLIRLSTPVFWLLGLLAVYGDAHAVQVTAFGPANYTRQTGAPIQENTAFAVGNLNGDFTLTVYNGGLQNNLAIGEYASSSEIKLNGAVIVGPQNFNQQTPKISVPVSLMSANQLSVELRGKPGGTITVEITGDVNTAPVADAGSHQTVTAGAMIQLDGSSSSDAEDDNLSYQWTLVGKPAGSAALISSADVTASLTVDVEGEYVAGLVVNDGKLDSLPSQVRITALPQNQAPLLAPIGNQTVAPGATLTLNITAADANGDRLTYSAQPLPLPDGASLDGETGAFRFKPTADQAGSFDITFSVSDGVLTDTETATFTVPAIDPAAATRFRGRLLDANAYAQSIVIPIAGATVSFLEGGQPAQSDAEGYFYLDNLPEGAQVIDIKSSTAQPAPDGSGYAGFRENYPLIAHVENREDRPFYLPRIDAGSLTPVDPNTTTVVNNAALGVAITVPPHTAKNPDGSDFTGDLSISLVPHDLAPAALPEHLDPALLVTIQPVGVTFTTPVPFTFPNSDNLAPGSALDIWSVDPEMGAFTIVGTGQVSADGQSVATTSGGVRAADWHTLAPPQPKASNDTDENEAPNQEPCNQDQIPSTSTIAGLTGCLSTGFTLPGYASQGQSRRLAFTYQSQRAHPYKAIPFDATIPVRSAVPPEVSYDIVAGGVKQGAETFVSTAGFSENSDETLRAVAAFDAGGFRTGRYFYQVNLTNNFIQSRISANFSGRLTVVNDKDSPLGAGWGLAGLQRLHAQPGGEVLVTDGGGASTVFSPALTAQNGLALRLYDTPDPLSAVSAGFSGIAPGQYAVADEQGSMQTDLFTIPNVNFTDSSLDTGSFFYSGLNGVIDAGSTSAEPKGDDISFQPPGGNETFGASFSGYLLIPEGGDMVFTVGVDDAFELRVNGQSIAKFIGATDFQNFTGTAVNVPAGYVPITLNYGEIGGEANIVLSATGGGLPGGVIPSNFLVTAVPSETTGRFTSADGDYSTLVQNPDNTYIRTLKNGEQIRFNADGLQTEVIDRNGNATRYTYDGEQRLTTITDPAGLVTTLTYGVDHLNTVTDPAGRSSRFDYDQEGNLIKITFPDGASKGFGYDARHLMTTETNERGFTALREYDAIGRLNRAIRADGSLHTASHAQTIGLVDPATGLGTADNPAPAVRPEAVHSTFTDGAGHTRSSNTDHFGRLISRTDANGLTTTHERDADGNALKTTRPDGSTVNRVFDAQGNLLSETEAFNNAVTHTTYDPVFNLVTSVTDALNHITAYHLDAEGNLIALVNALGHTTALTYNSAGQVSQRTDANGLVTTYSYNTVGLPETLTETPPAGGGIARASQISYDAAGSVSRIVTSPDGTSVDLAYDAQGRLLSITDALNQRLDYRYDAHGNRIRTDSLAADGSLVRTVSRTFDALNRLSQIKQPHLSGQDAIRQYRYDGADNLMQTVNGNGNVTDHSYDPGNRLIERIDALMGSTAFRYNSNGKLTRSTAPNGSQTDYQVDALDRIILETSPDRGVVTYAYDLNNNLKTRSDARGITINYQYDALNRLVAISYPNAAENVTLSYDACIFGVGRLCAVTDDSGETRLAYDAYGNLTEFEETRDGHTFRQSYQYNGSHQLTGMTLPSGRTVSYGRDSLQRLAGIETELNGTPQTILSDISYNAAGQVTRRTYGNALVEDRSYDLQGRLLQQTVQNVEQTGLRYDANSNILGRDTAADSHSYGYDALDRLINEIANGSPTAYDYDANGNRILKTQTQPAESTAYVYAPDSNQLDAITDTASHPVLHDAAGNQTQDAQGRQYLYNDAGRLAAIQNNGQTLAEYRTNANGQRTHKTANAITTLYHYDRQGHLISETQADGTPLRDYLWHGDTPVAQIDRQNGIDTLNYLHTDHLNTPRLATSPSQSVTWRWEGDAFGQTLSQSLGATVNLRFSGQYYDQESGLHYNWERYYDPNTGRYISSDPIGLNGGLNTYAYVGNNPLRYTDPYGLTAQGAAYGAAFFGGVTAFGSIAIDAVTGGANILATPGEIAAAIAAGAVVGDVVSDFANNVSNALDNVYNSVDPLDPSGSAGHSTGARPSTEGKHQEADARRQRDRGGEKGDDNRGLPRRRPLGWKGPWPPKSCP
jgi:RHS repeat-associated protein